MAFWATGHRGKRNQLLKSLCYQGLTEFYYCLSSGNRVDGRARWKDGGVLVVILVVVLCVLVLAIALLFIKKRREAPYSVPVADEGQDSIMPYHDDGAGEEDTFNYDIHHLMKYSYRDGHGTVTKSVNGKELAAEHIELLNQAPDGGRTDTCYCWNRIPCCSTNNSAIIA